MNVVGIGTYRTLIQNSSKFMYVTNWFYKVVSIPIELLTGWITLILDTLEETREQDMSICLILI
jgi:hypothetical protein